MILALIAVDLVLTTVMLQMPVACLKQQGKHTGNLQWYY